MMPPNNAPARLHARPQVRTKLMELKTYIDDARGNDPEDKTSLNLLHDVFEALFIIRRFPWASRQVRGASKNYRQQRVANTYLVYYFVNDDGRDVYIIDLRHTSQRPLKPSTLRKYKSDIE